MIELRVLEDGRRVPLGGTPREFARALGGSTLLHVRGEDPGRVRVVSTLLHGNEPSGLAAVHRWLRAGEPSATDVVVFIGNVEAALSTSEGQRALPGGRDWNRIWMPPYQGAEGRLAKSVLEQLERRPVEAVLDLHNNTGHNPPYGVTPVVDAAHINLCSLFTERLIWSQQKLGALVEATGRFAPSLTIECGRAGDARADQTAFEGLERFLSLPSLELERTIPHHMEILADSIRVQIRDGSRLAFAEGPDPDFDLVIHHGVDEHNFRMLPEGFAIGWVGADAEWPIQAFDEKGAECSRDWFRTRNGELVTTQPTMPVMMTTDRVVAAADCLFYIVQPTTVGATGAR